MGGQGDFGTAQDIRISFDGHDLGEHGREHGGARSFVRPGLDRHRIAHAGLDRPHDGFRHAPEDLTHATTAPGYGGPAVIYASSGQLTDRRCSSTTLNRLAADNPSSSCCWG